MLSKICETFMNQNYDLYLQHEEMLDHEKQARQELADSFQEKMKGISDTINTQKEERQTEYDKNQEIRDKISKAIELYKTKEDEFKGKMGIHNENINDLQEKLQAQIKTGKMGTAMKDCEREKTAFYKIVGNVKKISDDI